MKFKILSLVISVLIACGVFIGMNQKKSDSMSALMKENLKVLASGEISAGCEFDYIRRCVIICNVCATVYYPDGLADINYMRPVDIEGTCENCDAPLE